MILPSVLNGSLSTRVIRVVFSYCAGGKKTATKRLVIMSKIACSLLSSERGTVSVGMIAKWSLTFALLKIRLLGLTQLLSRTLRANGFSSLPNADFTVGMQSSGNARESVRG